MIITTDEYYDMGFYAQDGELLERCIQRAEYILNSLSGGRASAAKDERAVQYIKQAAAFQANMLYKEESAENGTDASSTEERVSIGDFSYTTKSSEDTEGAVITEPLDTGLTVIGLLKAAGCLYGGMEARS